MKMENSKKDIYATPRIVTAIAECNFYHVMEIPGHGVVGGEWDLRGKEHQYLGDVNFQGKRVLELGAASGFLSFYMEKMGAEVVAYDISENQEWDIVPFHQYNYKNHIQSYKKIVRMSNNAFWYAHRAYHSKAKVVYGSVYEIPEEIGMVDITTACAILLHVRDPFLALQKALRLTRDTVIVTDLDPDPPPVQTDHYLRRLAYLIKRYLFHPQKKPYMKFLANFKTLERKEDWWLLSPELIVNFLGVLGFENSQVSYHFQKLNGKSVRFYTVVGKRTIEMGNMETT